MLLTNCLDVLVFASDLENYPGISATDLEYTPGVRFVSKEEEVLMLDLTSDSDSDD